MSRILVIGQGNIGTFLGASLQEASHDVWHYLRTPSKNRISVIVDCSDRRKAHKLEKGDRYVYNNITDPAEVSKFEYVIFPVSHRDLLPAIRQLAPYLTPDQKVAISGNVWSGFEQIDELLPCDWFVVFPNFGGAIADGRLQGWLTSNLTLGMYKNAYAASLLTFKKLLEEAGFYPKYKQDIEGWLKTHFAYNAGMLLEAAKRGGYGKLSKKRNDIVHMYEVVRDFVDHTASLGIEVNKFRDGKQAHRSLFWNSLIMYLIFRVPGIAKGADSNYDEAEWKSYAETIVADAHSQGISVPKLDHHLELFAQEGI